MILPARPYDEVGQEFSLVLYFCLDVFLDCIYIIHKLKNTPVRKLIRALEQDGFQYKRRRVVKESIVTLMAAVL